jgi:hypothetical protein
VRAVGSIMHGMQHFLLSLRQEARVLRPGGVDKADVWLELVLVMTAQCVQLVACC